MEWNGENPMVLGIGDFDEDAAQRRAEREEYEMDHADDAWDDWVGDDDDAALWLHGWGFPSREADGKEHESSCRKADELAVEYHDLRG